MQPLYLQGWLAVGHCGWALSSDNDRHMEAVVGESSGGTRHTEGLSQRVPGFLAEDGVHQLDDLVLCGNDIFHHFHRPLKKTHAEKRPKPEITCERQKSYLLQRGLHVHMIRQGISSGHKHGGHLKPLFKLEVDATEIIQTSGQILRGKRKNVLNKKQIN